MTYSYPIHLEHIFISPGHNYFGRPKDGPGAHPTHDAASVLACAGLGLTGDRYFGVAAHFNAQVSFIAAEVLDALAAEFQLSSVDPRLPRRNIITRGVNLNQLIGREFALETQGETVHLEGAKACAPCAWMDAAVAQGAHAFLRGRGGLRARILTDGTLHRGPGTLHTDFELDPATIPARLARPRLP